MNKIQGLSLLAVSALLAGASYSFAGGKLNDAETTRSLGGVGNYLFYYQKDAKVAETDKVGAREEAIEENYYTTTTPSDDSINLGASSSGRAQ